MMVQHPTMRFLLSGLLVATWFSSIADAQDTKAPETKAPEAKAPDSKPAEAKPEATPPRRPRGKLKYYEFQVECENPTLPVINQQGGTCWCYASTSFVEAEIMRLTGRKVDLSEAFTFRNAYISRARHHILRQGYSYFDEGGDSHDILLIAKHQGFLPIEQYPGFVKQDESCNPTKMLEELKEVIKPAADPVKKAAAGWLPKFCAVLDAQIGAPPAEFEYEGTKYNPKSFKESLQFKPEDYVVITSYNHEDFYKPFVLDMNANFVSFQFQNLPIDEFESNIQNALKKGFTVSIDADVSEPFFLGHEGVAIMPDPVPSAGEITDILSEVKADQERRQFEYENALTTDDHQMHVVGLARDQKGNLYYKTKNSWGTRLGREGYVYISSAYLRLKILGAMMHKDGLEPESRKRLGL